MSPLRRLGRWWGGLWRDTHTLRPGCVPPIPDDAALFMHDAEWAVLYTVKAEAEDRKARDARVMARVYRTQAETHGQRLPPFIRDPNRCQSCNDYLESGYDPNPECTYCPNKERNESK